MRFGLTPRTAAAWGMVRSGSICFVCMLVAFRRCPKFSGNLFPHILGNLPCKALWDRDREVFVRLFDLGLILCANRRRAIAGGWNPIQ